MRQFTLILAVLFSYFSATATNPTENPFSSGQSEIQQALAPISSLNDIINNQGLTFEQLALLKADEVTSLGLSASASEEGILDADGAPLNIPGFVWGFCLGLIGMLIVYLAMDEGSNRKEQVMNALWGCIAGVVLWSILSFAGLFKFGDVQIVSDFVHNMA